MVDAKSRYVQAFILNLLYIYNNTCTNIAYRWFQLRYTYITTLYNIILIISENKLNETVKNDLPLLYQYHDLLLNLRMTCFLQSKKKIIRSIVKREYSSATV